MKKDNFIKLFNEYKSLLDKTKWYGQEVGVNSKVKINSISVNDYQKIEELQKIVKENISYLDNKNDLIFIFSNESDEELKKLANKRLSEIS